MVVSARRVLLNTYKYIKGYGIRMGIKKAKKSDTATATEKTSTSTSSVSSLPTMPSHRHDKLSPPVIAVIVVLVIGIILCGVGLYHHEFSHHGSAAPTVSMSSASSEPSVDARSRGTRSGDPVRDKKDALAATARLLRTASEGPKKSESTVQRVKRLESGDMSAVSPSLESMIRFSDMTGTPTVKKNTLEALVSLGSYVRAKNPSFATTSPDAWTHVDVDTRVGVAHVPVATLYPAGGAFTIEMVNVDGAWKMSPYTLLDSIRIMSTITGTKTMPAPKGSMEPTPPR